MRLQSILTALAATHLATAADLGPRVLTFPEASGINGTLTIDPAALVQMPDLASYRFPKESGIDGTITVDMALFHEKMSQVAAGAITRGEFSNGTTSLMAAGPTEDECKECQQLCVFLCLLPPACIWYDWNYPPKPVLSTSF